MRLTRATFVGIVSILLVGVMASGASAATSLGRIAFAKGSAVYSIAYTGAGIRKLASGTKPAWSSDRSRVAFVRTNADGEGRQVWVVRATGGTPTRLYSSTRNVSAIAYAPGGKSMAIAEQSADSYGLSVIRIITLDLATRRMRVAKSYKSGLDSGVTAMAFSANRTSLLIGEDGQSNEGGALRVLTLATGALRSLREPEGSVDAVDWYGSEILYSYVGQERSAVVRTDISGSSATELASGGSPFFGDTTSVSEAKFSTDGKRIVYVKDYPGSRASELWLMGRDGSGKRRLTYGSAPAWH